MHTLQSDYFYYICIFFKLIINDCYSNPTCNRITVVNQWRCLFSEQSKNKQHYHNHNGRDCQTTRWYNHYQSLVPKKPRKWTAMLVPVAEKKSSLNDTKKVKGCFPNAFKFLFVSKWHTCTLKKNIFYAYTVLHGITTSWA